MRRAYLWHQTRRWLTEPEITLPIGRRVDLMAWARHAPAGQRVEHPARRCTIGLVAAISEVGS